MDSIKDCWVVLEQNLRQTGVFLENRLRAEKFAERCESGMCSILLNDREDIVACAFLWETGLPGLVELGTVWVHPLYRGDLLDGKRLSKAVFADCQAIIANRGLRAIMLTCKERVAKLGREAGWTEDGAGDCQVVRYLLNLVNNIPDDSANDKSSPASPGAAKRIFRSW